MIAQNTHRARRTPEVGRTGARFGPPGQWRLPGDDPQAETPEAADDSPIGRTGARFGGPGRKRKRKAAKEQREAVAEPGQAPAGWWDGDTPVDPGDDHWTEEYADWLARPESHALVRPYAWTGGRTRAATDLAIEALVHTTRPGAQSSWELRAVTELCRTPRSVAEVAALMPVPLGVARVLVADLAAAGVVRVHQAQAEVPDLAMMNRVLAGLRRL